MRPIAIGSALRLLGWAVAIPHMLMAAVILSGGLAVDIRELVWVYALFAPIAGLMLYTRWRGMQAFHTAIVTVGAGLLVTLPLVGLTYAAMRLDMPLADVRLDAMDKALGFDWARFIEFVDGHQALASTLAFAYSSISKQLLLIPLWLALSGKETRACAMIFAYVLSCTILAAASIPFPAVGTYVTYGVRGEDLASINAWYGFLFLEQFNAVREQGDFVFRVQQAAGIITFPSGHAALAALCAWAAWDSRILRYPILVLNMGMSVAAISHANHYLVDVVAGFGIAGLAISATSALFYRPVAADMSAAASKDGLPSLS